MRIGVFGAGSIGTWIGVGLSAAGAPVTLLGRRALVEARGGLGTVGLGGGRVLRPGPDLVVSDDASALSEVDLCLVAVKSSDTAEAARALSAVLRPRAVVVSLQNGLRNVPRLAATLGKERVAGGVVTYNVTLQAPWVAHQATRGSLFIERLRGRPGTVVEWLCGLLEGAGEEVELCGDIRAVQAGKLLLNLNNGICAACGVSIAESVGSPAGRWCLSRCIEEGLGVMRAAGLDPASPVAVPLSLVPRLLRMPDALVRVVARRLLAADPHARSSTLQDLERGRHTEIDELNGEVVALAAGAGVGAPANARIVALVHGHERAVQQGRAPAWLSLEALRAQLERLEPDSR